MMAAAKIEAVAMGASWSAILFALVRAFLFSVIAALEGLADDKPKVRAGLHLASFTYVYGTLKVDP